MSDPSCTAASSSFSPRLTTDVVNFLARRAMTSQHSAAPFPLHSPGCSTASADSVPWSGGHHRTLAMPSLLPFDTNDADEVLLLDMLSQHQEDGAHATAPVKQEAAQGEEVEHAAAGGRVFRGVRKRPWGKFAAEILEELLGTSECTTSPASMNSWCWSHHSI